MRLTPLTSPCPVPRLTDAEGQPSRKRLNRTTAETSGGLAGSAVRTIQQEGVEAVTPTARAQASCETEVCLAPFVPIAAEPSFSSTY